MTKWVYGFARFDLNHFLLKKKKISPYFTRNLNLEEKEKTLKNCWKNSME